MALETDGIPLVVVGCDFRVASTSWREKMILTAGERLELFRALGRLDGQTGLIALITCNRSEWIVSADEPEWVGSLLFSQLHYLWEELGRERGYVPAPYLHVGHEAARHVFRVVAGLESFVMGEQQIARQFHMAVKGARDEGTSTTILNGLEKIAGAMTKRLRDLRLTRRQGVGIHSITAGYITNRFLDREAGRKGTVAVVGMGQIGRKVAGLLESSGSWKVMRVNRTARSQGWVPLGKLPGLLGGVDGIVFCTGSDRPVARLSDICRRKRKGKRLWIVDIGVPAQLEVDRKAAAGVEVVGLDRLVEEPSDRMVADWVRGVGQEVEAAVRSFDVFCRERSMVSFLSASQGLHQQYIREVIPEFVEKNFPRLSAADRKELTSRMRQLFIDYSSKLIGHFHSTFGMGAE